MQQRKDYNGHSAIHCKKTQVLIDYEGYIVSLKTNIEGRNQDNLTAQYNSQFREILGENCAISDAGFNCSYIIPGKKNPKSFGEKMFDRISRRKQVPIENVNLFFKSCKSVNKEDTFKHSNEKQLGCVFVAIGLYNLKRSWGY